MRAALGHDEDLFMAFRDAYQESIVKVQLMQKHKKIGDGSMAALLDFHSSYHEPTPESNYASSQNQTSGVFFILLCHVLLL